MYDEEVEWTYFKFTFKVARELDAETERRIWAHMPAPDSDDGRWPLWGETTLACFNSMKARNATFLAGHFGDYTPAIVVDDDT